MTERPAIERCAVLVWRPGTANINTRPCGEPVAELPTGRFVCTKCVYGGTEQQHDGCGYLALAVKKLVHVTLGPCEECGHDEDAHSPRHCRACNDAEPGANVLTMHPYVPTVTELPYEHEAEVSDGN